jgi:hypothetical protein
VFGRCQSYAAVLLRPLLLLETSNAGELTLKVAGLVLLFASVAETA